MKSVLSVAELSALSAVSVVIYSVRSARIGSMRLARCAGISPAAADTSASSSDRRSAITRIAAPGCRRAASTRSCPSSQRRRNADGEADRQQHQHFAHHHPDHDARLRAEREADAELLLAPRDDERHHAVEADRREQRRQQAEAGRQQRDQPIREQRLVELRLERLQLVDRHRRVQLLHFVADQAVGRRRRGLSCARRTRRCRCRSAA